MAETPHDMQAELTRLQAWRAQIDAQAALAQQVIGNIGDQARDNAFMITERGQNFGPPGQQLSTGGEYDWVAPRMHPVWAPEVAYEARSIERTGAATFEYEPLYRQLGEWQAAGKPVINDADDYASPAAQQTPEIHGQQRTEIQEQITAIQERLEEGFGLAEDWSSPGRYSGVNDDELETQLYGQLRDLHQRLETLGHENQAHDQHREEGMGY